MAAKFGNLSAERVSVLTCVNSPRTMSRFSEQTDDIYDVDDNLMMSRRQCVMSICLTQGAMSLALLVQVWLGLGSLALLV